MIKYHTQRVAPLSCEKGVVDDSVRSLDQIKSAHMFVDCLLGLCRIYRGPGSHVLSLVSLVKQPLTRLIDISPPALPSHSFVSLVLIGSTTAKYIKGNTRRRCIQYTVLFNIIYGKSTLNLLQNQDKDVTPG